MPVADIPVPGFLCRHAILSLATAGRLLSTKGVYYVVCFILGGNSWFFPRKDEFFSQRMDSFAHMPGARWIFVDKTMC